jgi:hypothetical protein
VALVPAHILLIPNDPFLLAKVFSALAIVLVVVTRGKLAVDSFRDAPDAVPAGPDTPAPARKPLSRQRIVMGIVLGLGVLYVLVNIAYDMINGIK